MMRSRHNSVRAGFTLVELMISAAITVMIMTILSICFQTSMKAMSAMRAQGDAADQLRAVGEVIKRDVDATHFLPSDPDPSRYYNRGRRLSDYDWRATPRNGFLYLDSPPPTTEGNDGVFESSRTAPTAAYPTGARLWMTCVLPGGSEGNLFTATVGGTAVSSEAAEVALFLSPMVGEFTAPGLDGVTTYQRFNLHRRQRLVATDANKQTQFNGLVAANQDKISRNRSIPNQANTMDSLVSLGGRELPASATIFTPLNNGDDIILSNVLSFEIKPTWVHSTLPARFPRTFGTNTDAPFDNLTTATGNATQFTFDTLGGAQSIRVNAVQVRLRIYDPKARTARQTTFVFDL